MSQPTIKTWSKILEASYLAIFLPPFFKNYGKRVIKSFKLYFSDSALVAFLTRQSSPKALLRGNMGGAFFEGLIVGEVWKVFLHTGQRASMFFWRSQSGLEIDLILQTRGKYWPVEIKLTATPRSKHAEALTQFKGLAGDDASDQGVLVCMVEKKKTLPGGNVALPWFEFPEWIREILVPENQRTKSSKES